MDTRRGDDDSTLTPPGDTEAEPAMYEPSDLERRGYGDIGEYGDPMTDPDVVHDGGLPGGDAPTADRIAEHDRRTD